MIAPFSLPGLAAEADGVQPSAGPAVTGALPESGEPSAGMRCRPHCGACCIAPSISTPMPGMPHGKPAGVRCLHLDAQDRCLLFSHPDRPQVCASLQPQEAMCRENKEQAIAFLSWLEAQTAPPEAAACPR